MYGSIIWWLVVLELQRIELLFDGIGMVERMVRGGGRWRERVGDGGQGSGFLKPLCTGTYLLLPTVA